MTKEDPSSSSARVQRPPHGQFVGESAGVGLSTQHGCVYVNGRMHYLGDYAVCKPGDDVSRRVACLNCLHDALCDDDPHPGTWLVAFGRLECT